jgi:hypothetical protein
MPVFRLPSKSTDDGTKGTVLSLTPHLDGTSLIKLDNGPARTINIVTLSSAVSDLLNADTKLIREHLMTRRPGHFRRKVKR